MCGGVLLSADQNSMGQYQSSFDEDLDEYNMTYDNAIYLNSKLPKLPSKADHDGRSEFDTYSRHERSGLLESLPIELIMQILSKMEINTLLKMARVSKNWNRLANQDIIFQKAAVSRFHIHPSRFYYLGLNPHQTSNKWKDLYAELDSGISTWSGYALDYVTNSGRPYEMELIIKSTDSKLVRGPYGLSDKSNFFRLTQFEGCCRWRTLADSLTNTEGAIVDPEGNSSIRFQVDPYLAAYFPRHITFTETGVVRGLDLVVPNLYQGLVCGNVVLGSYDPGHPDLVGSFICVLQDSLPLDRFRTDQFKPLKQYKGIWMTSLDKAIYMHYTVEKVNSGKISGTAQLFPFVSCRTTTRQGKVELESCVNLELQFQVDVSDDKSPSVSNGQFSLVGSSFYHQLWVQDCVPISQVIHINLNGDTITGLFSDPRPGSPTEMDGISKSDLPSHEVIHDDDHHPAITRIVAIALDSSENSESALHWAVKNILKPETDLVVLMNVRPMAVVPGPYGAAYMDFTSYTTQLEEYNRSQSHSILKKAAAFLKPMKFTVKAISLRGDAREELARKVDELHVDLLIIGSRGMGAIKRVFIGSTSDHLIHHVQCPVVVVKDDSKTTGTSVSTEPVPASLH